MSIFEAWRKEHKLAGSSKPDFRLEIRQSVQHFEKDTGYTLVFLGLRIINAGIDSAILEYSAHYKDEHFDEDCQLLALANKVIKLRMPNNSFFVMDPKDALNRRSPDKVIPKGGFVSGRLVFRVTGNRCDAIADGRAVITVKIQDYLGTEYREEFRGTGKKETPMYMPGEPLAEGVLRPKDFRKIKRDRN